MSSEMCSLFGAEKPGPSKLPSQEESFQKEQNGSVGSSCLGLLLRVPTDVANVVLPYQALGSKSGQKILSSLITRGRGRMISYLCMIITRSLMV